MMKNLISTPEYRHFVSGIKQKIQDARLITYRAANRELITLYFRIGEQIVENQDRHGWGKSVVEKLAIDLQQSFASELGLSSRNLWDMRRFYLEYKPYPKLRQLVAEIPWGHNLLILNKIKEINSREYYLNASRDMAWSRNVLLMQIQSQAYERHKLADKSHNFEKALPKHLAEQANEALKDVYMLDMLGITKSALEREIETRMVQKIKHVMLELGYGFSFIGNQYRIAKDDREYFIDILFFNRRLNSLVALEIKTGKFKPEYVGKMNFYLNLLDDFVREPHENQSIGIILCADRDNFEVDYALRGLDKPMGISEFRLTRHLPSELTDKLPDPRQIEKEIKIEMGKFSDDFAINPGKQQSKTDWVKVKSMTETEIVIAAKSDPDAKPLTKTQLKKFNRK